MVNSVTAVYDDNTGAWSYAYSLPMVYVDSMGHRWLRIKGADNISAWLVPEDLGAWKHYGLS